MAKTPDPFSLDALDGVARRASETVRRHAADTKGTLPVLRDGRVVEIDPSSAPPSAAKRGGERASVKKLKLPNVG
ncbi:hypothetical protein [Stappia indica]|uniref:Uncharacterized protein n=1 Tax=Stappia indica TaxID=538381 RepID=A0A857C4S1_9HYPH|nr:hypothetical protein [Stappia indica]QGZ34036.1 hypothetical protein GH266_05640 [Stappia indica]